MTTARACSRGMYFRSEARAAATAERLRNQTKQPWRAVWCEACGGYHLTVAPPEPITPR